MKKAAFLIVSVLFLISCNDDKKSGMEGEPVMDPEDSVQREFTKDDVEEDRDAVKTEDETVKTLQDPVDYEFAGRYKMISKEGEGSEAGTGCNCDCLEISFTTPSELCISRDQMYVTVRYEKTGGNTANVYLVDPSNVENSEDELPWDEFDRKTPVATLDLQPNGTVVLDWEGFHINGELATDYAIYGKKTLEGTYQRQ